MSGNDPVAPLAIPESRWTVVFVNSLEILEQRRMGKLVKTEEPFGSGRSEKETVAVEFVGVGGVLSSTITTKVEKNDTRVADHPPRLNVSRYHFARRFYQPCLIECWRAWSTNASTSDRIQWIPVQS